MEMADEPRASDNDDSFHPHLARGCLHPYAVRICNLHLAVYKNNTELFNRLVDINVNLNCQNVFDETPLLYGIKYGFSAVLTKRLINLGCDVNIVDAYKRTPLHIAIWKNDIPIAQELSQHGAHLDAQDLTNNTPLSYAITDGNVEVVCMLLCYGADVTTQNSDNLVPLMEAIQNDRLEIVRILLDYYDDFNYTDNNGLTALHYAIIRYGKCLAPWLIDAGVDVNSITNNGDCVLFYALYFHEVELFKKIWRVMNLNILLEVTTPLLLQHMDLKLDINGWVECLYLMLESDISIDLIEQCHVYCASHSLRFFKTLMEGLLRKRVVLADIFNIVNIYLALGGEVTVLDIDTVMLYGFETIMKAVIYVAENYNNKDGVYYPLLPVMIGVSDFSMPDVMSRFKKLIEIVPLRKIKRKRTARIIIRCIRFFSLTPLWKHKLIQEWEWRSSDLDRIKAAPEFPSLLELCRNRVHSLVKEGCKARKPYQFCDAMNSLEIPWTLKDTLLFQKPLYRLSN